MIMMIGRCTTEDTAIIQYFLIPSLYLVQINPSRQYMEHVVSIIHMFLYLETSTLDDGRTLSKYVLCCVFGNI